MTEELHKVRREIRILKGYALLATLLLAVLWFTGFNYSTKRQHFDEIDVERLNIVDSAGKYCFVITNAGRAPGAIIGGKEQPRSDDSKFPAIIFYNQDGDESGGLVSVAKQEENGQYYAASKLAFDRFRHDETIAFQYEEDQLGGSAGISVQDTREMTGTEYLYGNAPIRAMPDGPEKAEALQKYRTSAGPWATKRLFVGKDDRIKSTLVDLADRKGKTRLRLSVDSLGTPRIEFFNGNGERTYTLWDSTGATKQK